MNLKTIVGILFILIACSCSQQTTSGESSIYSGVLIENGINRGISYTDPIGNEYNLRYIPIKITNDSTISLQLEISFTTEYNPPDLHRNEKFKLVPLPREWGLDGQGVSEKMINELPNYIDKPSMNKTIEPGEKFIMAIGTLYSKPTRFSGVLPKTLFTQDKRNLYENCLSLTTPIKPSNSGSTLGLVLNFGESCSTISCGQISYLKH